MPTYMKTVTTTTKEIKAVYQLSRFNKISILPKGFLSGILLMILLAATANFASAQVNTYTYYFDGDGDGYGKTSRSITWNNPTPPSGYAALGGDCLDDNASVHPGATEICGNGIDDNCNGQVDENCGCYVYQDLDRDGYGKASTAIQVACGDGFQDYVRLSGDCNDGDASIHPGATEICGDGIDNNCSGDIDEGCSISGTYFFDGDGDGYGNTYSPIASTDPEPPAGFAKLNGDCNDGDATVHPGATEICGDGIDNNCDGQIDEGCIVISFYYFDGDGDGYGKPGAITSTDPAPPAGYVRLGGDCNDVNTTVYPGAPEICGDHLDNNCDGIIDDGCPVIFTYYFDGDGDGYGKTNSPITSTDPTPPAGYAKLDGDCNDGNASVHPGATEICGDGIDNNCNGQVDEDCPCFVYQDLDGDGYGKTSTATQVTCGEGIPGYVGLSGDCNDGDPSIHPGATEICGDGIDNNCDGQIDEGCSCYSYVDADGDGYGNPATATPVPCGEGIPGQVGIGGDCNDANPAVHPGATEICGDGIDNNCDGQIDEGCSCYSYVDADGDGYGNPATATPVPCGEGIPGQVGIGGDCNDANPSIHPGATEICGNGIDDNCNGQIDEGCPCFVYRDIDGDGYGETGMAQQVPCGQGIPGYVGLSGDCNDADPLIHPGATEICGDGIDNDCNGQTDEGCAATYTYYGDFDGDGYGKTGNSITNSSPTPPTGYVSVGGDCNDGNASIHPGATEICGDGIDNNCDGQTDEGCTVTTSYHLTTTSTGHGTIGTKMTFVADAGYHIADIQIDGSSAGAITSYTFNTLTANHTVNAIFALNTYTITATAATNGTLSPAGATTVNYGGSLTYTITPKTGYHTTQVTVDGTPVGAVNSYTFSNVTRSHTIKATFVINTYTIVSSAGNNGTITPNGSVNVNYGGSKKYTIKNNTGYHIVDVLVDGVSVGAVKTYTFSALNANHTISASFASNATNNSIVAAKQLNETALSLSAKPNPFKNDLTVMFTVAKKGKYDLTISDMSGRVLSKQKLDASAGSNMANLNITRYTGGSYFITLTGDSKTKTVKVIKAQ